MMQWLYDNGLHIPLFFIVGGLFAVALMWLIARALKI